MIDSSNTITLQQGENCIAEIALSEPLDSTFELFYSISDSHKIRLQGSESSGSIERLDPQHFRITISPQQTADLFQVKMELACKSAGGEIIAIATAPINLIFTQNRIKEILL